MRSSIIFLCMLLLLSCTGTPKTKQPSAELEGAMHTMSMEHFYNYVEVKEDTGNYAKFSRFYPEQVEAYSGNSMFKEMSYSAAGVVLNFITTGNTVQFKCKTTSKLQKIIPFMKQISISNALYAIKYLPKENILKDRVFLDGIDFMIDGTLVATKQVRRGTIRFRFANPTKARREIKIFFPVIAELEIKNLKSNGIIEKAAKREKILCLGDSITQGFISGYPSQNYVALMSQKLNVDAINQGVGGYTYQEKSLNGLEQFNRQFGAPKFITVAYGTNDWYYKTAPEEFQKNIAAYYKHLLSIFPATPIYVITPIWRLDLERGHIPFEQVAQMIKTETAKYPSVKIIDGMTLVPHDARYFSDGYLHPNAEGFGIMADNIIKQANLAPRR